jgi:agmatine/peptidylarginine deiminase
MPESGGGLVGWSQIEATYAAHFEAPTDPVPIERLIMPWEATRAVVLVLPLKDWQRNPAVQETFRELLRVLLPRLEVIALHHETDYRLLADWLLSVENDAGIAPHLANLVPVSSEVYSIWARDFTPFFARGQEGRLVALDASFLAARRLLGLMQNAQAALDPMQRYFDLREGATELKGMRGTNAVASVLTPVLEARWGVETALSRAPLYLLGGDFLPVTPRAALVSALTLQENGGRADAMRAVLKSYYGIEEVGFYENLPGDTIEHLDFILHPIAPDVILAAAPPPPFAGARKYHQYLERELSERLRRNRARLAESFPRHRIVEVPMPPPLLDDDEAVVDELFLHCVQTIAGREGLPFWPEGNGIEGLDPLVMDSRLVAAMRAELGVREWRSPLSRRSAVGTFLGRPVPELIARHVEQQVHYRTYVNSLFLRTPSGEELVLVPRYAPSSAAEADLLADLEGKVIAAYREALPEATFHWIDCTPLTDLLGAVHCLTATIPAEE